MIASFRFLIWLCLCSSAGFAQQLWPDVLARMPLPERLTQLNRTNCVEIMLRAFQSNNVVKALVFMPGATDEFYMFRRAAADLTNPSPSVLDAVCALTNQTFIQATFRSPMLLLHSSEDVLDPIILVADSASADLLKQSLSVPHLTCNDFDWNFLEPILSKRLEADIRPWPNTIDSWHFYRHSFAAWNLSGWEAIQTVALAGKTKVSIFRKRFPALRRTKIVFEPDTRFGTSPFQERKSR